MSIKIHTSIVVIIPLMDMEGKNGTINRQTKEGDVGEERE
jgi:hypothetical protein